MNISRWLIVMCLFVQNSRANDRAADAEIRAARDALAANHFEEANRFAEKAVSEAPERPDAWLVLGHCLSGQVDRGSVFKRVSTAQRVLSSYKKAIELSPNNIEAHESILEYYRRAPAIVGGSLEQAEHEAAILSRLDPP